jgi:hypothetical protein
VSNSLRRILCIVVAVVGLLVALSLPASARHNFSMLEVAAQEVAAGEEVVVSGFSYTDTAFIRFGSVDGPVLAALEPTDDDIIKGTVRIPEAAPAGRYVLYAVQQDEAGNPSRFPGGAALTVAAPGGPPLEVAAGPKPEALPDNLIVADAFSVGDFVAVALAAVGVASLVTLVAYGLVSPRRRLLAGQES